MIEVEITKTLGDFRLDVSFQSEKKRIGILGASGCGKSMTLKSIAGIETPDKGRIRLEERVLYDSSAKKNVKTQQRKVGYLFQNYALFPTMTVEKNIGAGLRGSRQEKQKRIDEMTKKFGLTGLTKRLPGELSGGQQQRVALARIMACEPEVLLLDEPFSAMDVFLKDRLQQELLKMLADYPGTVIMVSHSRDEIYRFSEDLLIMQEGRILTAGPTKQIFACPEYMEAARLTGCKNFSPVKVRDAHHLWVTDWGLELRVKENRPDNIRDIGYRAHDFEPVWKKDGELPGENCIQFIPESEALLPFEKNYYLKPEGNEKAENICWFVQREKLGEIEEKGLPDYLRLREEKIMFLK